MSHGGKKLCLLSMVQSPYTPPFLFKPRRSDWHWRHTRSSWWLSAVTYFFRARFPSFIRRKTSHISQLELLALVVAVKLWGSKYSNTKFWVRLDNEASVYAINSGRTVDSFMNACLRELAFQSAKYNIEIKARHIATKANTLPDLLSRWYRDRSAQQKFCQLTKGKGMRHSYVDNKLFLFDNNWWMYLYICSAAVAWP